MDHGLSLAGTRHAGSLNPRDKKPVVENHVLRHSSCSWGISSEKHRTISGLFDGISEILLAIQIKKLNIGSQAAIALSG